MENEKLKGFLLFLEQLKDRLSRNTTKKIIALVLSMALWVYVMGAQNPVIEDTYRSKVHLKNNSTKYEVFFDATEARVTLSAPRSYFVDYKDSDIQAYIDVSDYGEGEYDIPIEATYPRGFELNKITPTTVHARIEPILELQKDIELTVSGAPAPNTTVRSIQVPNTIVIIGPKSKIARVNKVHGFVVISGESESFTLNVPINSLDENGRDIEGIREVPESVDAFVEIVRSMKKSVPLVADVTIPNGKEISKVSVDPDNATIEGAEDIVSPIELLQTVPITVPAGLNNYKTTTKVIVPNDTKINVEEVTVTVELKDAATSDNSTSDNAETNSNSNG